MRMIDADKCPCNDCVSPLGDSRGCSIFPCREFGEWYKNTAYNVDKVVEELENKSDYFVDPWVSYMFKTKSIDIVKRGGVDDYSTYISNCKRRT